MREQDFTDFLVELYDTVLTKEIRKFNVKVVDIKNAIRIMNHAYQPDPGWESKLFSESVTNYNEPAFRCGYLHKYAMCYTGLVYHLLLKALRESQSVRDIVYHKRQLRMCSLGGGPGSDAIGALAALLQNYYARIIPWAVTVVDVDREWRSSFDMIMQEFRSFRFDRLQRKICNYDSISAHYVSANLLADWTSTYSVMNAITTADVVLMVKFISAAAYKFYTEAMIKRILENMKSGAMLLFIDNASGGFYEMMNKVASQSGMISLYGPLKHYDYGESKFSIEAFGFTSQSKTRIVFEIFQKTSKLAIRTPLHQTIIRSNLQTKIHSMPRHRDLGRQQYTNRNDSNIVLFFFILAIIFVAMILSGKENK